MMEKCTGMPERDVSVQNDTPPTTTAQHWLSVKDFGAVGDGVADDTEAIQQAIDKLKPNFPVNAMHGGGTLFFPVGTYLISKPLKLYSFITLQGEGATSILCYSSDFEGEAMVKLSFYEDFHVKVCQAAHIFDLHFSRNHGTDRFIAAIAAEKIPNEPHPTEAPSVEKVLNCTFKRLWIRTPFGLVLDTYAQHCHIDTIMGHGNLEQFIELCGNHNLIENLDREGSHETSGEARALIHLKRFAEPLCVKEEAGQCILYDWNYKRSSSNTFKHMLLEGSGEGKDTYILLDGAENTVIEDVWAEMVPFTGRLVHIKDSYATTFRGKTGSTLAEHQIIKIEKSKNTLFETLRTNGDSRPLWEHLDIDAFSNVRVYHAESRLASNLYFRDKLKQVQIDHHVNATVFNDTLRGDTQGLSPNSQLHYLAGQNLLRNPSFEMGEFGWIFTRRPHSIEYPPSEVGSGLMASIDNHDAHGIQMLQPIEIPQELVGQPLTFTIMGRVEGEGSSMHLIIKSEDGSINADLTYAGVSSIVWGWSLLTQTFTPQTAATHYVGVAILGTQVKAYLDEASLGFGVEATANLGKFASLEIGKFGDGQRTITTYKSIPPNGTWKQGDIVFNSEPEANGYVGWICTKGGSRYEMEWRPFGKIE
jgi:hypothetical protein